MLESGFGLRVDGFFNKLFKAIKFSDALFYFDPHQKQKAFLEVPNYYIFFKGTLRIKFYQGRL